MAEFGKVYMLPSPAVTGTRVVEQGNIWSLEKQEF